MELRHLKSFAAAVEQKSFTRAAECLGLTQAAISQHVAMLEGEFGTRLFTRQGRGVRPTECGKCLFDYARKILDLVDAATRQIGNAERDLCGILRIASSTVPSEWLVPELITGFRHQCPGIRESLSVTDSRMAANAVSVGDADVGFVGEPPGDPTLIASVIAEDELALTVSIEHPLAISGSATLEQLQSEPLILRSVGSASRSCFERSLTSHGISASDFTIAMEVNSNDSIRAAVERGVGVAFLSMNAGRRNGRITQVKIEGFRVKRHLHLIHKSNVIPDTPTREFLDFVRKWQSKRQVA